MINDPVYTPAGYRNMVKMSKYKYILVEGRDDKITLKYLIEEFFGKRPDIHIHGAHQIRFGSSIGNRERVENLSGSINKKEYAKRFVGFVDREFRGFSFDNKIEDVVGKHNIIDRLIWARGHSIENYYFDFLILRRTLRSFSVTPYFDDALELFERNLERVIILACAAGLAGNECGMLQIVKASIDWTLFDFDASGIIINATDWSRILNSRSMRSEDVYSFIEAFQGWLRKVIAADFSTIRWLCHGHIGITVIWAAYAKCVFEVCKKAGCENPRSEANSVLRANETVRCNGCASEWAQQALNKACEYPMEIFSLLDFSN